MKYFGYLFLLSTTIAIASDFSCPGGKTYPVSLTFDDGPAGAKTHKAMDILKNNNVLGTFFVLGENFDSEEKRRINYPILERMKREGHIVGSHTFNHIPHTAVSSERAFSNIDRATELLKGYMSPIVRLPYGDGSFATSKPEKKLASEKVMNHIKEKGLTHVGWSIDTNDWDVKKRPFVLESMMKQICQQHGGVILFHDIHQNTIDHLDGWIHELKKAGHSIEPLTYFYKNLENKSLLKKDEVHGYCQQNEDKPNAIDSLSKKINEICNKIK